MRELVVLSLATAAPQCETGKCPLRIECAQHSSAGDAREQSGYTPKLYIYGKDVICFMDVHAYGRGILILKNGELVRDGA